MRVGTDAVADERATDAKRTDAVVCMRALAPAVLALALLLWIYGVSLPPIRNEDHHRIDDFRTRRSTLLEQQKRWQQRWTASGGGAASTSEPKSAATSRMGSSSASLQCPPTRRPYHVLLTASAGPYQQWQSRIFYYHYATLREVHPCSDMGGFTRLLTTPGAKGDGLMHEMRTVVMPELTSKETMGFVVLNRPTSVLGALDQGKLSFDESYVLICETDHILLDAIPNLASPEEGIGYPFHYMLPTRNQKTIDLVRRFAGSAEAAARVQQLGPSPVLLHMDALRRLAKPWRDVSFDLKKDGAADAEFGWMLEMWGYSIGAAIAGVRHKLSDTFQLEPSQQFGTSILKVNTDISGQPREFTHHILHYTFGHEYSLEGVPTIDSKSGAYGLDKRQYQEWLPRYLRRPPRCALESTQVLWSVLHEAMAAHDRGGGGSQRHEMCVGCTGGGAAWGNGSTSVRKLVYHDSLIRARVDLLAEAAAARGGVGRTAHVPLDRLSRGDTALALVATGPWEWRRTEPGSSDASEQSQTPFYFLRGGQLETPWGSAAWAASTDGEAGSDPIVLYLCGRSAWTHSLRLERAGSTLIANNTAEQPAWSGLLRSLRLVITERSSGDILHGTLNLPRAPAPWDASLHKSTRQEPRTRVLLSNASSAAASALPSTQELTAAVRGLEDAPRDVSAAAARRRLVGTGPWRLYGSLRIALHLLSGGLAHIEGLGSALASDRVLGQWRVEHDGTASGAAYVLLQYERYGKAQAARLKVRCWHLEEVVLEGGWVSHTEPAGASLVWSRPASRCFPTCTESTHALTRSEKDTSVLAKRAMGMATWTWAGIPGLKFSFSEADGGGLLVTPWGHGSWGIVSSRDDVLVAEFAQKRHMLLFSKKEAAFTSTRCDDGEVVHGRPAHGSAS